MVAPNDQRITRGGRAECTSPGCARPTPHAYLCADCASGLRGDLRAVAGLLDELETTVTRQDQLGEHTALSVAAVVWPLPWNDRASRTQHRLVKAVVAVVALYGLSGWCDTRKRLHGPYRAAQGGNWGPLAQWLAPMPDLALIRRMGPAADRLARSVRAATKAIDLPSVTRRALVGPCPRSGADGALYCDGEVWAELPAEGCGFALLACSACEHCWDTSQWRRAGRDILRRQRVLSLRAGRAA